LAGLFQGTVLISLGSLFSRQPAPLLGLDVSTSGVKLVELGRDKAGNLVLERCASEPLERGWIADGAIEKFEEVAEAIRRLLKKVAPKPATSPWPCRRRRSSPRKLSCPVA